MLQGVRTPSVQVLYALHKTGLDMKKGRISAPFSSYIFG